MNTEDIGNNIRGTLFLNTAYTKRQKMPL